MAESEGSPAEAATPVVVCPLLVSFWAGAATMAFELVGARLLMPVFGMGMEVWAVVIAVSLGALAVGYWAGGRIADAWPSVLTLAVVLVLAGVSLLLVRAWGRTVMAPFQNMSLVTGSCCSAVSILAAPLLFLGTVQPILARLLVRTTARTGSVVGALMAAGTSGGIMGTILTGLLLIPQLGISKTVLILAAGTVISATVVLGSARRWRMAAAATVAGTAIVAAGVLFIRPHTKPIGPMRVLRDVDGLYGHLEVLEGHGVRALVCNGIFQTVLPVSELGILKGTLIRGRDYIELIPYLRPEAQTALLIGVGGGLYEQALALYGVEVNGVEIEPAVIPLANEYFGLAGELTVADGRAFLARQRRRFDAVILDAFIGGMIPEHLCTREAFEEIAEHLNPDGMLAVRLIGQPKHPAIRAVARTLKAVFVHTTAIRSSVGDELQHIFLFGSKTKMKLGLLERLELAGYGFTGDEFCNIEISGARLLTDDRSGLTLLSRDIMAQHRYNSLELRRKPLW